MQEHLETFPPDLDHKIDVLQENIGKQIIENHHRFDMLSEAQQNFFMNAARKKQTKSPVMSCISVVTLLICFMYSKTVAFGLAAVFIWLRLSSSDRPVGEFSSPQACIREYHRLMDLSKRKKRIQDLKYKIESFLRCNPKCFCVGLERRTHHKHDYSIVSIGDFKDY